MKYFKITFSISLALVILYTTLVSFGNGIDGKYQSYDLFQHDIADTMEIRNGKVYHKTCCGDDEWGIIIKNKNSFIIHLNYLFSAKEPVEFVAVRTMWGIQLSSHSHGISGSVWLRRKLFTYNLL